MAYGRGGRRVKPARSRYILVEHPDEQVEHAVFRTGRYVMQVYDKQEKHWLQTHTNTHGLRLDPVLPIVFYSGTRSWDQLEPMQRLVHHGDLFGPLLPALSPVFVNLAATEPEVLQSRVGTFGWILWLIQQKRRQEPVFRDVLRQVVSRLDRLHAKQRGRWEQMLWFAHALVYYAREKPEREPLADFIRATVRQAERPSVQLMGQTIAESLIEKGKAEGALAKQRETLLRLLRLKFKRISSATTVEIETTQDSEQLDHWLDAVITADKINEIPFQANNKK